MPDFIFSSVLRDSVTPAAFFLCTAVSLVLGALTAAGYMFRNHYSKSFVVTLALLPAIVQMVIFMVNGNLGVGVAVAGTFSLVRFRSVPGSAREIGSVFLSMAVGLATGMGYLGIAACFTVIMVAFSLLYTLVGFGEGNRAARELKITLPENVDYSELFDDLFEKYAKNVQLLKVRTTNMGSLYQLVYRLELRDDKQLKEFLDALRCRNGNLDISCAVPELGREEL